MIVKKADVRKKVVIVGAGPAGLEAARVAGERGHEVVVFEAANDPGGQIRLTAQKSAPARNDQHHRLAHEPVREARRHLQFQHLGRGRHDLRPKTPMLSSSPRAACRIPRFCRRATNWSFRLLGYHFWRCEAGTNVLIFDDAGDHAGLQAAEFLAAAGAKVEIMTPDRSFAPEVMAMNLVPYMRSLQKLDVTFTVTYRLEAAEKNGNQLIAHVGSDYGGVAKQREVDQVVVNHGTIPLDDLYFELKPGSSNLGEVRTTN